jgi:hypothetical protein
MFGRHDHLEALSDLLTQAMLALQTGNVPEAERVIAAALLAQIQLADVFDALKAAAISNAPGAVPALLGVGQDPAADWDWLIAYTEITAMRGKE